MVIGRFSLILVAAALLIDFASSDAWGAAVKVACIGASTTSGDGSTAGHHFPDELGIALGGGYQVKNFGVSGTTMLKTGDNPYWNHAELRQAIAYQPDIAIFWFGGNDAKPQNWTGHMAAFITDYEEMLRMFQALPSHPKTYLFLSMVIHDVEGIPKTVLEQQVLPEVKQIAADKGSFLINYHDAFITHPEYFPDGVHPNDAGTAAIGKFVANILLVPSDGGTADVALDAPSTGGGDATALPPPTGDDAATASASDAGQPVSSSSASGSMGPASTTGSSGSAPQANSGSATGASGGNSMTGPGASGSNGYSPSGGGTGCSALGARPASREAAWVGCALLGLLALRRSHQRKRRHLLRGACAVLCTVLPVAACSSGVAPNPGGAMSSSGQAVAPPPVVDGGSPPPASGGASGSAAPNASSGVGASGAGPGPDAGTGAVDSAAPDAQGGTDADTSGAPGPDAGADDAAAPGPFTCSWVLGIHTTQEWFQAGFLNVVDPTRWEASGIEMAQFNWQDANSGLWTQAFSSATSCAKNAKTPDRIVFCGVDGASTTVAQFLPEYVKVVNNIKTKFPSVKRIDLMTLARAPGDKECIGANRSGSSYIKAAQDDAIAMMVAMYPGFVFSTPKWEVQACSDFGLCPHISLAANMTLAKTMGQYFLTH
jgi:lysophospholipase L1-like esterase